MKFVLPENIDGVDFLKRVIYLAWQASKVEGMGFLKALNTPQTEDQIFESVLNGMDGLQKITAVRCDHIQGRMMKITVGLIDKQTIEITDAQEGLYRPDYQSFCSKYQHAQILFDATRASFPTC